MKTVMTVLLLAMGICNTVLQQLIVVFCSSNENNFATRCVRLQRLAVVVTAEQ